MIRRDRNPALIDALAQAGGVTKLADLLGLTNQAVSKWDRVPAERVLDVERITGVSRYRLRPDIYGDKPPSRSRPGNERRAAA